MIIETLMKKVVLALIVMFPSVPFAIDWSVLGNISSLLYGINYIMPMEIVVNVIGIKLSMMIAKAIISIVIRLKSFIPTMGA